MEHLAFMDQVFKMTVFVQIAEAIRIGKPYINENIVIVLFIACYPVISQQLGDVTQNHFPPESNDDQPILII